MLIGYKKVFFRKKQLSLRGNSVGKQLLKLFAILFTILSLHIVAMLYFEGLNFEDAIWLTMTSATTVGYGDISAQTFYGRIATITLLYIAGIAILAQVAAMYFEYRQEIKKCFS